MANYESSYTGAEIDNAVGKIVNNSATNGQVLKANGSGGASWAQAGGHTLTILSSNKEVYIAFSNGTRQALSSGQTGTFNNVTTLYGDNFAIGGDPAESGVVTSTNLIQDLETWSLNTCYILITDVVCKIVDTD